jgi:glycosyltransferase involved in cell wall biosynthesis
MRRGTTVTFELSLTVARPPTCVGDGACCRCIILTMQDAEGQGQRRIEVTSRGSPDTKAGLRILLVGHACSPGLGSEPGLTWNWAWHLSEHHDVWVLSHPKFRAAVEDVTLRLDDRGPRMVWVELPKRVDPFDPARSQRGIHLHYVLWQRAALAQAHRLQSTHGFDIVHHVGWGTVNAPPALWRLGLPFVWGPLGGGQAAPLTFARYLGWGGVLREAGRTVRRQLMPFVPSLRRAVANSAVILATNRETAEVLHRAGARRVEMFLDNGVAHGQFAARRSAPRSGDRLELLWAGSFEPRKALPLALEVMASVRDVPARLTIAGDGPFRGAYERHAVALGLDRTVRFLGHVPHSGMRELFAASDAFFFTSLQDSFGSVVIEAMAAGLPVLALDHQGVGALIPEETAIKVPVTSPAATIRGLADGIRALAASPGLGQHMGEAARRHADFESWSRRVVRMNELYRHCLTSREGNLRNRHSHSEVTSTRHTRSARS